MYIIRQYRKCQLSSRSRRCHGCGLGFREAPETPKPKKQRTKARLLPSRNPAITHAQRPGRPLGCYRRREVVKNGQLENAPVGGDERPVPGHRAVKKTTVQCSSEEDDTFGLAEIQHSRNVVGTRGTSPLPRDTSQCPRIHVGDGERLRTAKPGAMRGQRTGRRRRLAGPSERLGTCLVSGQ